MIFETSTALVMTHKIQPSGNSASDDFENIYANMWEISKNERTVIE